jgi:hypothetical protein
MKRNVFLHWSDNGFMGKGTIRVWEGFVQSSTDYLSGEVPNMEVEKVIGLLADARTTDGVQEPVIALPNDFPNMKIGFIMEDARVEFYPSSRSAWDNPWAGTINPRMSITVTGDPDNTYGIFKKRLADDIPDELADLKNKTKLNE